MSRTEDARKVLVTEQAPAPAADDPRVVQALEEYASALKAGLKPDRHEYLSRYADVAEALAECLDGLEFIQTAVRPTEPALDGCVGADFATNGSEFCPDGSLGDFRILREVGRGGMGVVYEAIQISLGRRVALKVLPFAAAMDSKHLQRFKNEAQAAAHLHHQNIVPVYAVGCDRGVHYYAMQFIDGQTLATMIRGFRQDSGLAVPDERRPRSSKSAKIAPPDDSPTGPYSPSMDPGVPEDPGSVTIRSDASPTPTVAAGSTERSVRTSAHFQTLAKLGVQAAEALEHAHQMGVVHRDIKPANLLVDTRGNLWITDFGLSHCQTQVGLTMSGDLIGTLRYMSPEQAMAQRILIDHRTDIYSLGATLFEFLTLEPAFAGSDRQELLRQIAFEEPRRPRALNRSIPVELETIILKAMEKNPAERYATAQELADDLQRYLRDEPIRAKRPTILQRARKWSRRHKPVVAAAVAVLLISLLLGGGSALWIYLDKSAQEAAAALDKSAQEAAAALQEAKIEAKATVALTEAERLQNLGKPAQAREEVGRAEGFLAHGGSDALRVRARHLRMDLDVLVRLAEARLAMAAWSPEDAGFDGRVGEAVYKQIFNELDIDVLTLGPDEAARRIALRSLPVQGALRAALDDWICISANARDQEAQLILVADAADPQPEGVMSQFRNALARYDGDTICKLAEDPRVRSLPPTSLANLGSNLIMAHSSKDAVDVLRQAQQDHPGDFWINQWLGVALVRTGQPEEAIRFLGAALAMRDDSAGTYVNLGIALTDAKKYPQAVAAFDRALALRETFFNAHYQKGKALWLHDQDAAAEKSFRRALELRPKDVDSHHALGMVLLTQKQYKEAEACFRLSMQHNEKHTRHHLAQSYALKEKNRAHARACLGLGDALKEQGKLDEALEYLNQACKANPKYAEAHYLRALTLVALNKLADAAEANRQAIKIIENYPDAHNNLGTTLRDLGKLPEAAAAYREALRFRPNFGEAHCNLGHVLFLLNQPDEAGIHYRKALELKEEHADAHVGLGGVFANQRKHDKAAIHYRRAIAIDKTQTLAYAKLARSLEQIGKFAEAITTLRDCQKVLTPQDPYQLADVVEGGIRDCERMLERDRNMERYLSGELRLDSAAHVIELAEICTRKQHYETAASIYEKVFAARPALAASLKSGHRMAAARVACLAGCGHGKEKLSDPERAHRRKQAVAWLRADLDRSAEILREDMTQTRALVQQGLKELKDHPDLAGLRSMESLLALPREERIACLDLWADVEALWNDMQTNNVRTTAKKTAPPPTKAELGQVFTGTLTREDPIDSSPLARKGHHKIHTIALEAGQPYLIDLQGDFDTWMRIENSEKKTLLFNDDVHPDPDAMPGDGLNSRMVFIPTKKDTFRLVVTSFDAGATGAYTLSFRKAAEVGEPVLIKDQLQKSDKKNKQGQFLKFHKLKLKRGSPYTIELESADFDTILGLIDREGTALVNNAGITPGNKRLSRIDFTPKVDAEFHLMVTTRAPGDVGAYTLTIRQYELSKDSKK